MVLSRACFWPSPSAHCVVQGWARGEQLLLIYRRIIISVCSTCIRVTPDLKNTAGVNAPIAVLCCHCMPCTALYYLHIFRIITFPCQLNSKASSPPSDLRTSRGHSRRPVSPPVRVPSSLSRTRFSIPTARRLSLDAVNIMDSGTLCIPGQVCLFSPYSLVLTLMFA